MIRSGRELRHVEERRRALREPDHVAGQGLQPGDEGGGRPARARVAEEELDLEAQRVHRVPELVSGHGHQLVACLDRRLELAHAVVSAAGGVCAKPRGLGHEGLAWRARALDALDAVGHRLQGRDSSNGATPSRGGTGTSRWDPPVTSPRRETGARLADRLSAVRVRERADEVRTCCEAPGPDFAAERDVPSEAP